MTGVLTAVPGSPFSITGQSNSIIQTVISPTGRFVYFLDQGAGSGPRRIFAYLIQANGALGTIAGSPFNAVDATHRLEIDPLGRYLYGATSSLAGSAVTTYRVDPGTGALSSVGTPANGSLGIARSVVHPSGQFLYVTRDASTAPAPPPPAIDAYTIDTASGQLTLIGSVAASVSNLANMPFMDPQGRFLYVTGPGGISGFAINATTGALTPVPGPPALVNFNIGQSDIDPTGKFLYSPIRQGVSEGVALHTIDPSTGQLTLSAGTFSLGANVTPNFVKVDGSGRYLFVATSTIGVITSLAIDPPTGLLSFRDSEPAGTTVTQFTQAGTQ